MTPWMLLAREKNHGLSQPPTDPGSPTVKSQRLQSPRADQIVYLSSSRASFVSSAEVIVDHHPATLGQSVAVTVDVAADIRMCIEDKQTDLARPQIGRASCRERV